MYLYQWRKRNCNTFENTPTNLTFPEITTHYGSYSNNNYPLSFRESK